jgi:hypothetical protein
VVGWDLRYGVGTWVGNVLVLDIYWSGLGSGVCICVCACDVMGDNGCLDLRWALLCLRDWCFDSGPWGWSRDMLNCDAGLISYVTIQ